MRGRNFFGPLASASAGPLAPLGSMAAEHSSAPHTVPGLPILRSNDLVNWEFVAYAMDKLDLDGFQFRWPPCQPVADHVEGRLALFRTAGQSDAYAADVGQAQDRHAPAGARALSVQR